MKPKYPPREKDRWGHAMQRPLTRTLTFEMIELMRADLFEYLDVITTDPYEDEPKGSRAADIQKIGDRLTELTPHRARALRQAMRAGRVEHCKLKKKDFPLCGPVSAVLWRDVARLQLKTA